MTKGKSVRGRKKTFKSIIIELKEAVGNSGIVFRETDGTDHERAD